MSKYSTKSLIRGKNARSSQNILFWAIFLLILSRTWGFVFTKTVLESVTMVYISYISIFLLFSLVVMRIKTKITDLVAGCLPYMFVTLLGIAFSNSNYEMMTYWFASIVLILVASKANILEVTPYKLIFWSAFVAMIGVYFQWLFLSLFNTIVAPLIYVDKIDNIEDAYGMRGFTPQQGTTSIILIFGEIIVLYLREKVLPKKFQNKAVYWILIFLMIGSIFLTGKRTIAILSLAIPLVVYFLSSNKGIQRRIRILVVIVLLAFVYKLLPYFSQTFEIYSIQRVFFTVEQLQHGEDISSAREYKWEAAIKAFHENPIMGVGVGKYGAYTKIGADTHNTYLQVLCEQGIIGITFYIIGIICCLFHTIRALFVVHDMEIKKYIQAAFAMQLIFALYAITGNVNIDIDVIYFYLATAFVIQIETIYKKRKYENIISRSYADKWRSRTDGSHVGCGLLRKKS